ncbi:YidH family protein [Gelidibacter japonicus]|uniref:YidH family protein n=1 Tax=Gelidibacter japonicus TaxID=1962232 RepID=UPI0013D07A9A|nr:DUF202 domain-containing protein [Gelidibacter japonicus]
MEVKKEIPEEQAISSTDLAFERTFLAENRTLMAWTRTAITLISFGFTIYKFLSEVVDKHPSQARLLSPRTVGLILIGIGMLALIMGLMDYNTMVKRMKINYPNMNRPYTQILAVLVLVFGLLMLVGILFRQ